MLVMRLLYYKLIRETPVHCHLIQIVLHFTTKSTLASEGSTYRSEEIANFDHEITSIINTISSALACGSSYLYSDLTAIMSSISEESILDR